MIKDITFFLSMLGWFNGIILSLYFLFFIKDNSLNHRLFGLLLLLLSLRVGKSAIWWFNPDLPIIYIQIGLGVCFLIGPLLYFYIRNYISNAEHLSKKVLLLLVVHLLAVIFILLFLTQKEDLVYWKKGLVHFIYFYWFAWTIAAGFQLKPELQSFTKSIQLSSSSKWILSVYFSFLLVVVTYMLSFMGTTEVLYITGPLIFSLVIYLNIMIFFFKKNVIYNYKEESKYKDKIGSALAAVTIQKLDELMGKNMIFTKSELKIADVSRELDMSVHHISQVLNDNYNISFNNYINQKRIEYSKKLIETKSEFLTLEAIGHEAGFNSKTTFFTMFKKLTGMTPKEYREQHKKGYSGSKL
ncbi:MAG TPA: helix-turn-helix transcriptional regulator [Saprospiraceae bacterium]|nr:helix-turn-helix transcriptional regulator [Saprospiraceae bacterium]